MHSFSADILEMKVEYLVDATEPFGDLDRP